LANRLGLNSKNSSKPPSTDPNRKKKLKEPGGQHGHIGTTLKQVADPHEIKDIKLDRSTLPPAVTELLVTRPVKVSILTSSPLLPNGGPKLSNTKMVNAGCFRAA
jgi:hypothetical protein